MLSKQMDRLVTNQQKMSFFSVSASFLLVAWFCFYTHAQLRILKFQDSVYIKKAKIETCCCSVTQKNSWFQYGIKRKHKNVKTESVKCKMNLFYILFRYCLARTATNKPFENLFKFAGPKIELIKKQTLGSLFKVVLPSLVLLSR